MSFFEPYFWPTAIMAALLTAALPRRFRWALLLLASVALYAAQGWKELAILLCMLVLNVGVASSRLIRSRTAVRIAICVDVAVLFFFKYVPWLVHDVAGSSVAVPLIGAALPLGISFYIFQLIAYVVDSHRAGTKLLAPQHAAAFIVFFPQLVAGPILRASRDGPQFAEPRPRAADVFGGLLRIAWGVFKKRAVADSLAPLVGAAFAHPGALSTPSAIAAILGFTLQIYLDFSGYADMAVGLAKLFGIAIPENFDRPYLSASLRQFWRRWHITLSNWLRDYLYIPLGGNRTSAMRSAVNLMLTMLIGGLWHGANWTYLAWGAWHGAGLLWERALPESFVRRVPTALRCCLVLVFVSLGWVLFRADSLGEAVGLYSRLAAFSGASCRDFVQLGAVLGVMAFMIASEQLNLKARALRTHPLVQGLLFGTLIGFIYLAAAQEIEFIYWRF